MIFSRGAFLLVKMYKSVPSFPMLRVEREKKESESRIGQVYGMRGTNMS